LMMGGFHITLESLWMTFHNIQVFFKQEIDKTLTTQIKEIL